MANRSRLVQISSEKDDSPNCFSKGAVKEEVLDILIPVTIDAFRATFPISLARLFLVRTTPFVETREKSLFLVKSSSSRSSNAERVDVYQ
jgi:hypothetical protein